MPDPLETHEHELSADAADEFMATYNDACAALKALREAAYDLLCPSCDPTGERLEQVQDDLRERYAMVVGDADMFLGFAADTRNALLGALTPACDHDHDEQHGEC